jgi:hypothetical protein
MRDSPKVLHGVAGAAGYAALGIEVEMSAEGANWNGKPDPREAGGTPWESRLRLGVATPPRPGPVPGRKAGSVRPGFPVQSGQAAVRPGTRQWQNHRGRAGLPAGQGKARGRQRRFYCVRPGARFRDNLSRSRLFRLPLLSAI